MRRLLLVSLLAGGCVEEVDLRPPVAPCPAGQRADPRSHLCVACRVDPDPTCPCAVSRHAAPFPYCEGDDAARECAPCAGDITACSTWDPATATAGDCALLEACCTELAAGPTSIPCCLAGLKLVCNPSANLGKYERWCVDPTCCAPTGKRCLDTDGPCAPWQTCVTGHCAPACEPGWQVCNESCVCE